MVYPILVRMLNRQQTGDIQPLRLQTIMLCKHFQYAHAAAEKHGIKMIYGMEGMLVDDGVPIAYKPQDVVLKDATYVVFDVETTGLSNQYDKSSSLQL